MTGFLDYLLFGDRRVRSGVTGVLMERRAPRASPPPSFGLSNARYLLIATPSDMAAFGRSDFPVMKGAFACAEVSYPCTALLSPPDAGSLLVSTLQAEVAELARAVAGGRFVAFDRETLERELNRPLREAGRPELKPADGLFLAEIAERRGDGFHGDCHSLGTRGGARLAVPPSMAAVSPQLALYWMASVLFHYAGGDRWAA
jgi:hypothetical protein